MRRALLFAVAFLVATPLHAEEAAIPMAVNAAPIAHFQIGSRETRFGPLEFVGGLSLTSPADHFGAFSSFRFASPGAEFIGVADTGFWFFGRLTRDAAGKPIGFADFSMQAMVDGNGATTREKWTTDAEGIALKDGLATVSFERVQRIADFQVVRGAMGAAVRDLDFLVPRRELRNNRGFETIAYAPEGGRLGGARVAVAERSIDGKGNCFAAVLEGPGKGIFTVARHDGFDITDGAFLPDGDLLLLERRFSLADGVAMRLRRIEGEGIRPGALADGPVLLTADMGYQIDNMEALDVWVREDGATMVSVMSDDNHSLLQRNLYLEFRLVEE
ncbi:esterase-like activity of phytase family protein [Nitratireductor sp. ZSWI3]|uniref:esterase-like activity of phytase family protein n=1 Tax=Nitratireductor sp. ZSWI3 TaxID=2966359 RepID=UPI00214FA17F|nr:esterase-like activity of phytase family protein [Nitratireductor sp. ZSWI3]MCR4266821.1 esterase-like activity of phytase family protein [Nitratireductor sp. ZSWI3]